MIKPLGVLPVKTIALHDDRRADDLSRGARIDHWYKPEADVAKRVDAFNLHSLQNL